MTKRIIDLMNRFSTPAAYILLFGIITYLAFKGLDNNYFWADEADTAFFSKAFLKTGHISGWDGRNLYTWRNGTLMKPDLSAANPPLMYLVTAASFRLFGITTFAGRLPHVIAGLLSLLVLVLLLKTISRSVPFQVYTFLITGFSISFLMFIRCVRYFSLCMLCAILALYFYHKLLENGNLRHRIAYAALLFVSCLLFFLSNYLLAVSFIAALLAYHIAFYIRTFTLREYVFLALISLPFVMYTTVHICMNKLWIRVDYVGNPHTITQTFYRLFYHIRDLEFLQTFPSSIAIAGLALAFILWRNKDLQPLRRFGLLMFIYIIVLSIFSLQTFKGITPNWYADIRYMVPLIPAGAICTGSLLAFIHSRFPPLSACILAAAIFTNIFFFRVFGNGLQWFLPEYLHEIHTDYKGPYEAAIEFVKTAVPEGDTIIVVPPDYQPTMLFYLTDRNYFAGYLRKSSPAAEAARNLPKYVFERSVAPDWIACFGWKDGPAWVKYYSRGKRYGGSDQPGTDSTPGSRRWTVPVYFKDYSRPEIPWHKFTPATNFDIRSGAIYFLERK